MQESDGGHPPRNPSPSRRLLLAAATAFWIALALFLLFVWPKPYRKAGADYRINRLTGSAQSHDRGKQGWKPAKRRERNTQVTSPAAASESPVGGDRSGGEAPAGARGEGWWYEGKDKRPPAKQSGQGDQWWYRDNGGNGDKAESREPSGGDDSDAWWHD